MLIHEALYGNYKLNQTMQLLKCAAEFFCQLTIRNSNVDVPMISHNMSVCKSMQSKFAVSWQAFLLLLGNEL